MSCFSISSASKHSQMTGPEDSVSYAGEIDPHVPESAAFRKRTEPRAEDSGKDLIYSCTPHVFRSTDGSAGLPAHIWDGASVHDPGRTVLTLLSHYPPWQRISFPAYGLGASPSIV